MQWRTLGRLLGEKLGDSVGRLRGSPRHRGDTKVRRLSRQLAEDCQAFYDGHLAEQFETQGLPPEPWMWMNLLAHGSELELRKECATARSRRTQGQPWREARSYLSARVLDGADATGSLVELQQAVLLPIEHSLVADGALRRPSEWVVTVETAIEAHCRSRQRGKTGPAASAPSSNQSPARHRDHP